MDDGWKEGRKHGWWVYGWRDEAVSGITSFLTHPITYVAGAGSNPGTSPFPAMRTPHTNRFQDALQLSGEEEDNSKEVHIESLGSQDFLKQYP